MVNVKEFLRQESIEIHFTSPRSHTGNSDISRAHSSLLEHIRTLTLTERDMSISEKVLKATEFYNTTIHSTINCKPLDVQLDQVDKSKIAQLMQKKKEKWVSYCNKNREQQNITHDKVYIKNYVNERYKEERKYRKTRRQKTKIFHKGNLIFFLLGIITVLLRIKSTLAQPSLQVEEVHSATGLLLIKKGNEKLIRDYKRIYHKIDLRQYELALLELEKNIAALQEAVVLAPDGQVTILANRFVDPQKGYTLLSTVLIHLEDQDGKGVQCIYGQKLVKRLRLNQHTDHISIEDTAEGG
ncbi:unnamed protein product [Hermetia illucens]|uniref:Integrase catalytic domain-containing protein n=1 Tax=Hermetia illucens TaxID=343691 RepID=A0A7R8UA73_HERIL|nr:unnamed protein product [Hermetia illucens]